MTTTLFHNIYRDKKVLVTGNTGFKGSWLSAWLIALGAKVYGISNRIPTNPSHFEAAHLEDRIRYFQADIREFRKLRALIESIQPDFLFHLAAQPLVRQSYQEPLLTLETNIMGTAHVLEALRSVRHPCHAVFITSDKCYDNVEWTWGYRETDPLGGKDPYSASKGGAELVIKTYAHSYFQGSVNSVKIAVGRAGNVMGGGDWAADRIVPDSIVAWAKGDSVKIRAPWATRPWQHVLEPLSGYLRLGQCLAEDSELNGEPFNFGPPADQNFTVTQLLETMKRYWPEGKWQDVSIPHQVHEARLLKLCCDKALHQLGWKPTLNFNETIQMTVDWYRHYYENPEQDIFTFTSQQIAQYVEHARTRNLVWVG